jgi:protocatechuate 3,4-dioxygenase beta subunit
MKPPEKATLAHAVRRRRVLVMLGAAGTGLLTRPLIAQPPMPACVVTPAQTEGPFFADTRLQRSDIRSDPADGSVRPGTPLVLTLRIHRVGVASCAPLAGAMVDVWHCDAAGAYAGTADAPGHRFLRGYQMTGAAGTVHFTTIYPGWYPGRAVHIHFKVRAKAATGSDVEFTSQLYFDETVSDRVLAGPAYPGRGRRRVHNTDDGLYRFGGPALTVTPVARGTGYAAAFDIGLHT